MILAGLINLFNNNKRQQNNNDQMANGGWLDATFVKMF